MEDKPEYSMPKILAKFDEISPKFPTPQLKPTFKLNIFSFPRQ